MQSNVMNNHLFAGSCAEAGHPPPSSAPSVIHACWSVPGPDTAVLHQCVHERVNVNCSVKHFEWSVDEKDALWIQSIYHKWLLYVHDRCQFCLTHSSSNKVVQIHENSFTAHDSLHEGGIDFISLKAAMFATLGEYVKGVFLILNQYIQMWPL